MIPTDSDNSHAADAAWEFVAGDEQATERLGAALARALEPGTILALNGELGSGKTRLVQAVAVALGVPREAVTSPTFVLIQEYAGRLPVFHFDTYRLNDLDEFLELGADELFESDGVCLIEWAQRVEELLPADRVDVAIRAEGPDVRRFLFSAQGPRSCRVLQALAGSMRAED